MKRKEARLNKSFLILLILIIYSISFVSAADVAYIYNKNFKIDNNVKSLMNQLNLSVDMIQENKVSSTNFSKYKFIFVGDERFSKPKLIPIGKYPTVITNYYHGYDWGLTDNEGVSNLGRTEPMSVKLNGSIIQVYTQGVYNTRQVAIPYYYLGKTDKSPEMTQIAGTYSGNGYDLGDVISYADKGVHLANGKATLGNICFFGIVESDYWTADAKSMFLNCLTFVGSVCSRDSDCPATSESSNYCMSDGVYKNTTTYSCVNPGTIQSRCAASVSVNKLKNCSVGCSNGQCVNCYNSSQCGTDGFVGDLFCQSGNVFQNYITFTCNSPGIGASFCTNSTAGLSKLTCLSNQLCSNGQCLNVTCRTNNECDDNNNNTQDICLNPGTPQSSCEHKVILCNRNSDCGTDGLNGLNFCKDGNVYQNSSVFTCNNPGTFNSSCSSINSPQLKQTCNATQTCFNGQCLNVLCNNDEDCGQNKLLNELFCQNDNLFDKYIIYKCNNPGTGVSSCSNATENRIVQDCSDKCYDNQCVNITCYNDVQCNDNNANTEDKCLNPGTPQSSCEHKVVHCSKNLDCGANGFDGNKFCMNGNSFENFVTWTCSLPGTGQSSCISSKLPILSKYCDFECVGGECLSCFNNLSCGSDSFVGNKYCINNSVYQDYKSFSCLNPGTGLSTCASSLSPKLVQDCSGVCFKGQCNGIKCKGNSDCDDGNVMTKDQCNNQGTQSSYCSHTAINCNSDADCGNNGFFGSEFCVGNNVFKNFGNSKCLNPGTSNSYCSVSVASKLLSSCGDGYCESWESNYCKSGNVYHKRNCINKNCAIGQCMTTNSVDEELVQICEYDCSNGNCIDVKCKSNSDCDDNNEKTNDKCLNPGTGSSSCHYDFITCKSNAQCGQNGLVGDLFCSENKLYQTYRTYICHNSGTTESYCSSSLDPLLKQSCSQGQSCNNGQCVNVVCTNDLDCNDNNPMTLDSCSNPGTTSSYCGHTAINCNSDSQCGTNGFINELFCQNGNVFQNYVTYKCNNPGSVNSVCSSSVSPELKQTCAESQICNSGNCLLNNCIDNDNDGYDTCSSGSLGDDGKLRDCDDNKANVHPGAVEICNGMDDNCDGRIDENNGNCGNGQVCSNGQCNNIVCNSDNQCNDHNDLTIDKCLNPGTGISSCSHIFIICNGNSDCGTDGFVEGLFCQTGNNNIFQNFLTYSCVNPGTISSSCSVVSAPKVKQNCLAGQTCSSGSCVNSPVDNDHDGYDNANPGTPGDDGKPIDCNDNDASVNPGATEICDGKDNNCNGLIDENPNTICGSGKICSSGSCVNVVCYNDSGCNDNNALTLDKCINPGTVSSTCTHTATQCADSVDNDFDGFIDALDPGCWNDLGNPATYNASLNNESRGRVICSNDSNCNDNNVLTLDKCINPGTGISSCTHTAIICNSNSDCGTNGFLGSLFCQNGNNNVFGNYLTYTCSNPGTVTSSCSVVSVPQLNKTCATGQICSNGACVNIVCSNDLQCNDNNAGTIDKCNNPGTVSSFCTNTVINCTNNVQCPSGTMCSLSPVTFTINDIYGNNRGNIPSIGSDGFFADPYTATKLCELKGYPILVSYGLPSGGWSVPYIQVWNGVSWERRTATPTVALQFSPYVKTLTCRKKLPNEKNVLELTASEKAYISVAGINMADVNTGNKLCQNAGYFGAVTFVQTDGWRHSYRGVILNYFDGTTWKTIGAGDGFSDHWDGVWGHDKTYVPTDSYMYCSKVPVGIGYLNGTSSSGGGSSTGICIQL